MAHAERLRRVSELVDATRLSQPNVSNHLRFLYDCGLVARQQQGRYVSYQLSNERVAPLLEAADAVLAEAAREIDECGFYSVDPEPAGPKERAGLIQAQAA